ncbi:MAG TPA: YceI family protein [Bryobacteraceae bacterium]|jgi:polyisoprenoid-binding protein YceI|nr:YceI family protein [Bryobacteraceae bacterium]
MQTTYRIDPAHSTAQFVVRHMMITNVRGGFGKVEGTVVYDPENPAQSSIEAAIDVASIETRDAQRDAHLKSADFLDADKFPKITFKSSKIEGSGGEFRVSGDLTIHGVTRPVVLQVEGPTPAAKDPWGNTRVGASATTRIKRSDFGLTWNAALETGGFLIGDEVKIELEIQLIESAAASA